MKKLFLLAVVMLTTISIAAENQDDKPQRLQGRVVDWCKTTFVGDNGIRLDQLDFGITAGSTGVGFEFQAPLTDRINVRAGGTFMPKIHKNMKFKIQIGTFDGYVYDNTKSAKWNKKEHNRQAEEFYAARLEKLNNVLYSVLGYKVRNYVDAKGEPAFNNFKLLFDLYPFKNKHWHLTTGFYLSDRMIATAYNTIEDMNCLVPVKSYNTMYKKALGDDPILEYGDFSTYLPDLVKEKMSEYGMITIGAGQLKHDIYATEDVYYDYTEIKDGAYATETITDADGNTRVQEIRQYDYSWDDDGNLIKTPRVRYKKGDLIYKAGEWYKMVPDDANMVGAEAFANAFKPYFGFGYGGYLSKERGTYLSFDAGVMLWGGTPNVYTHDGIDIVHDLYNIDEKLNKYVKIIKAMPVFPVVELKLTQRIF